MSSFLDKYRKNKSELMAKVMEKMNADSGNYPKDDRVWTLSRDKEDKGEAVIRFLPDVRSDENWVRLIHYGFQGPSGQWYIENSLRTIGKEDPVNDANKKLYASKNKSDEAIAKTRGAKTTFISNILVIKDKANPENEGKVFLFKYGKSIFEYITNAIKPKFDDDEAFLPFDPLEGRNFAIKIFKSEKNQQFTYEASKFLKESAIAESDEEIEEILEKTYDLTEFIADDQFKSYAELNKRFIQVWDGGSKSENEYEDEEEDEEEDDYEEVIKPKSTSRKETIKSSDDEDDDDLDFFK